jgi:tRNA-dihydrouridine synthase B
MPMLKPLKIGKVEVGFPVVLASLAGYSDLAYRLICRSLSAPYCTTEAMLDRQLLMESRLLDRLVRLDGADHPVAGQIMGCEPAIMAQAAARLSRLGFDVVDLNFACPVKKVLARKRGGYLMAHPELGLDIIKAVLDAVPDRPVTLKLRRAFEAKDTTAQAFWKIAHGAFNAGIAGIGLHARSVEQKYTGTADWAFLARVKREFPDRTIIGSGDIHTASDALRMIEQTGVDGVMAARGAIGNPWIFEQARDIAAGGEPCAPGINEQREVISRHFRLACDLYGPNRGLKIMRNFGIYYARRHPQPALVRAAVIKVQSERDWQDWMEAFYSHPEA